MERYLFEKTQNDIGKVQDKIKSGDAENYAETDTEIEIEKDDTVNNEQKEDIKKIEKIEIPGFGEIEYTEKTVMFPKHLVKETGGVKGYIRKMVKWDELEKNNKGNSYTGNIKVALAKALTGGEFLKKTYNHAFRRSGARQEVKEAFGNQKLILQKIGYPSFHEMIISKYNPEVFAPSFGIPSYEFNTGDYGGTLLPTVNGFTAIDNKDGIVTKIENLLENLNLPEDIKNKLLNSKYIGRLPESRNSIAGMIKVTGEAKEINTGEFIKNYIDPTFTYDLLSVLNSEERKIFVQSLQNSKAYTLISFPGLSLSGKGITGWFENTETFFGFGEKNKVFHKCIEKTSQFLQEIRVIKDNKDTQKNFDRRDYCRATYAQMRLEESFSSQDAEYSHPLIPSIFNNEGIPELRWCHADYAAISTKNGFNILEMIT